MQSIGKNNALFCQGQTTDAQRVFLKKNLGVWLQDDSSSDDNFLHDMHHPLQKDMRGKPLGDGRLTGPWVPGSVSGSRGAPGKSGLHASGEGERVIAPEPW